MRTDLSQYYQSTKPSARLNYITSLDERKNFEINGTDFLLRDINVFATTKANQRAILEQLKQLSLSNNTAGASIYDLGNILKSDSISEVTHILKQTEKKADQMRQQDMQQQQQMQEQMIQAKQQEEQLKREFEASEKDKDRQAEIIVAQIRSAGYGAMMDINENKQSDYMDAMDQIQKSENYQSTMDLNREKEANKMMQSREKLNIEREKINAQREIANTQLRIAQENKNRFDAPNKTEQKDKKKKK